jgi:zinc transport system ATP-binding protein
MTREAATAAWQSDTEPGAGREVSAVSIRDLSFSYGGEELALDQVSLEMRAGEFLAIIGPNGGGKTTLIRLMLGLLSPLNGEVKLFGHAPRFVGSRIGYVPQFSALRPDFPASVLEMVLMGGACPSFFGGGWTRAKAARQKALGYLDVLGLADLAAQPIAALSGGQRQRALVARALMSRPEHSRAGDGSDFLLLLDEPTASTDQQGKFCFYEFLGKLRGSITLVVVSHDLFMVSPFFSSVAFVDKTLTRLEGDELTAETLGLMFGRHQHACPMGDMLHAGGACRRDGCSHPACAVQQ